METATSTEREQARRRSEWFVPTFGPERFRLAVGLLFLPYTGMVLAFCVIGSTLALQVHWDRVIAIVVIYFFGLGIAAHALDALGGEGPKPWGSVFSRRQLWIAAVLALAAAYLLAFYYIVSCAPLLSLFAALEGFFVFAYNLECFGGKFHTDSWFAFSWGGLPLLAGYVLQTNRISFESLLLALAMGLFSLVEIKVSRLYKALRQNPVPLGPEEQFLASKYEAILKSVSLGVIFLGAGMLVWRLVGPSY